MNRRTILTAMVCVCLLKGLAAQAIASEGAASNYFPGAYGSLLVAVAPEPGPVLANLNLFYTAEADRAFLQGRANASRPVISRKRARSTWSPSIAPCAP